VEAESEDSFLEKHRKVLGDTDSFIQTEQTTRPSLNPVRPPAEKLATEDISAKLAKLIKPKVILYYSSDFDHVDPDLGL